MMRRKIVLFTMMLVVAGLPAFAAKQSKETTFESIVSHYESIRLALVNDSMKGVADHAKKIASLADEAGSKFHAAKVGVDPAKGDECVALLPEVKTAATTLARAKDLEAARSAFVDLSTLMVRFRKMSSSAEAPKVLYCSMAEESWLQSADEVGNPYLGQKMPTCGVVVED